MWPCGKLANGLMGRDQKNKFLLSIKSWILLIFNKFFLLIVVYSCSLSCSSDL